MTVLPPLAEAGLPRLADLVFGGHDVVDLPLAKRAQALAEDGVIPPALLPAVADRLEEAEAAIRPGIVADAEPPTEAIERARLDLSTFQAAHGLERVVVVNCATTEPPLLPHPAHDSLDALRAALGAGRPLLPPSSLYAWAAFEAGCPFVDFTPSAGAYVPALDELALARGVPYAGRDGKTGETLVRSALAPMFAYRALRVRSWAGTNLLGGGDGAALAGSRAAESKRRSKGLGLEAILGYPVDAPLHIDYVPDLGQWKTAWDHVAFEGFLGTQMRLQFTWEGCDSSLAAPLVLDLARLVARAHAAGHRGALAALAFFFKDPIGTTEHRLGPQFDMLCRWAAGLGREA